MTDREFVPLNIAVLTVSDSRDETTDKSGKLLIDRLENAGHKLCDKSDHDRRVTRAPPVPPVLVAVVVGYVQFGDWLTLTCHC